MESNPTKVVSILSIAGSDSGAGAGIQADIKAAQACGVHACTAITAVTSQNTVGVQSIYLLPVVEIIRQIESCLTDFAVEFVKIGMLGSLEIADAVYETLRKYKVRWVIDPVMKSSNQASLSELGQAFIRHPLLMQAYLITPNIDEAAVLSGETFKAIATNQTIDALAKKLFKQYNTSILVKGGHLEVGAQIVDVLMTEQEVYHYEHERIESQNTHGTGCTLASLITAKLALGYVLNDAVQGAIEMQMKAISRSQNLKFGAGKGPLSHVQLKSNTER